MIAADSSVAVVAALRWHEAHPQTVAALRGQDVVLPAHAATETYSVLTRLPHERRMSGVDALAFLEHAFRWPPLALSARGYRRLLGTAAERRIVGGAVYDAVVAATAIESGAALLTRDRRAIRVYDALGAKFRLVE